MPNVDFREAKFQNFSGDVPTPLALDPILVGSTLHCFRRACNDSDIDITMTTIMTKIMIMIMTTITTTIYKHKSRELLAIKAK